MDDGYIEVRPSALGPLRRLRWFRPERADRADITEIRVDKWSRRGLRIETRSGSFDRFVLIPSTARERAEVHGALRAHGYAVT